MQVSIADRVDGFLERLERALYSSDFTEPLGQYRTQLFYDDAKKLREDFNAEREKAPR